MNIPDESKRLFHTLGWLYVCAALCVIVFPRWIVLVVGIWATALVAGMLGFWAALRHKNEPLPRRVCSASLAGGYVVGAAIITARILSRITTDGWMGSFR